jgi:hypothetical protein
MSAKSITMFVDGGDLLAERPVRAVEPREVHRAHHVHREPRRVVHLHPPELLGAPRPVGERARPAALRHEQVAPARAVYVVPAQVRAPFERGQHPRHAVRDHAFFVHLFSLSGC